MDRPSLFQYALMVEGSCGEDGFCSPSGRFACYHRGMTEKILGSIGVLLGLVGAVMIYKWGLPQPDFGPVTMALSESVSDETNRQAAKKAHSWKSYCGISFVIVALAFQGLSIWL